MQGDHDNVDVSWLPEGGEMAAEVLGLKQRPQLTSGLLFDAESRIFSLGCHMPSVGVGVRVRVGGV